MRVAAIVLNFRLADDTVRVVHELLAGTFTDLVVLVLDNGSGDGSATQLESQIETEPGRVELMLSPNNLGYCAGINRLLRRARELGAEHALLLNNDTAIPPDLLSTLVPVLDNDPSLAGVTPTIVGPNGKTWCQGGAVRFGPNGVALRNEGREPAPTNAGPEEVDFLAGACVLYRLADLEAVGDLNEQYFMYVEDVDLGARLRGRGQRLVWIPWARVEHAASGTSGGGRSPLRKHFSAVNSVRYLRQHGNLQGWLSLIVFDLLLWPVAFVLSPRASLAKITGIWAGLRGHRLSASDVARYLS